MLFIRTGKRAQKGLRIPSEIEIPAKDPSDLPQGTFSFVDPNTVLFTFAKDGTKVLLVLQKAVSYTVKQPEKDALSQFVPPPTDNEGDDDPPPLNPK
jgi:hypothetical protein